MAEDNEKQLDITSNSKEGLEELVSILNYLVFDGGCMKPESNEESEHILPLQFDSHHKENVKIVSIGTCPTVSNWKPGKLSSCFRNKFPNATDETESSKRLINLYLNANTPATLDKAKNVPQKVNISVKREAEVQDQFSDPSLIKRPRRLGNIPMPYFKDKPFVSPFRQPSTSGATNVAGNNNSRTNLFTSLSPSNPSNVSQFENRVHLNPVNPVSMRNKPTTMAAGAEDCEDGNNSVTPKSLPFKSAYEQLMINDKAKGIKRTLPATGSVHIPEMLRRTNKSSNEAPISLVQKNQAPTSLVQKNEDEDAKEISDNPEVNEIMKHDCMKNVDPKMVEAILNEIVDVSETNWNDIAGLEGVKNTIKEIIIWPILRPDIFCGLRGPPKGILLFGPPGTGKTMIGRLISTESKSTFFNISASSLTSKWIGDGEKMVRALFQVARVKQPAVIFIDEIDSILTQRSDTEHESSRRMKTEFLIQFDGCGTKSEDRILVIGVTNRPQELDEAARRRLVKRIYVPLPDVAGREQLVRNLLKDQKCSISNEDFEKIADLTAGYSGADIHSVCHEAAYGPIRDVGHLLEGITAEEVRPMLLRDFEWALKHVKSSVATSDLDIYADWDDKYGCQVSQK